MEIISYVVLGVIQGLTEFLPVSSSGHLVIAQQIIPGISQPGIMTEVILHAGTLSAVIYFYREKILKLDIRYILLLIIGTVPAVVVGLFFKDQIEGLFETIRIVGLALMITSIFNLLTDKHTKKEQKIGYERALIIGIFQAFAIIPGISRSGSTIFAGTKLGVDKKEAASYSFLLSVPAILGANLLELLTLESGTPIPVIGLIFGFTAAFVSGVFAIRMTIRFLTENNFKYFAVYTLILGLGILIYQL